MSNKVENEVKSAAQIADDRRKEEERKKREEAAERERIKKQAEAIACNFVRIAGVWYKKCQNTDGEWLLERYSASDIIADYGKKLGPAILAAAPHCINSVNEPEHIKYEEIIESPSCDLYYNMYFPLKHKPSPGAWIHIEKLMRHIFGEQYEKGLDYVELMYLHPKIRLPILVLVSIQKGTGKSAFCNFLRAIFGQNAMAISQDTINSRFNGTWGNKLLAYCEETKNNDPAVTEKLKNYSTAEVLPMERKGKDVTNSKTYIKIILCSNDELHPTIIDRNDNRHWVRQIPEIDGDNEGIVFMEKCKEEIPAFLDFLQNRKLSTKGNDRLWFTHAETETEAWRKIVEHSREQDEQEIAAFLNYVITKVGHEVSYSFAELIKVVKEKGAKIIVSDKLQREICSVRLREILHGWNLYESKMKKHKVYYINEDGKVVSRDYVNGRVFTFTNELSFLHEF